MPRMPTSNSAEARQFMNKHETKTSTLPGGQLFTVIRPTQDTGVIVSEPPIYSVSKPLADIFKVLAKLVP